MPLTIGSMRQRFDSLALLGAFVVLVDTVWGAVAAVMILRQSRRLSVAGPSKGPDRNRRKATAAAAMSSVTALAKTKAAASGILPEFSKFDCLPGRAGGTPGFIRTRLEPGERTRDGNRLCAWAPNLSA